VPLGQATAWQWIALRLQSKAGSLGTVTIHGPTIVVRGKPQGKPVYNVFVIDGIRAAARARAKQARGHGRSAHGTHSQIEGVPGHRGLQPTQAVLESELRDQGGGSWTAWQEQVAPLHRELRRQLDRRPKQLHALMGTDGFLFYRRSLQYVVGGDIQAQPAGKNPLPALVEFKKYLAGLGVDLLVVPVPSKPEVFPDKRRARPFRPRSCRC